MADTPFRASGVRIVRGYFVTCETCNCDVAEFGGYGMATRAEADEQRKAHIEEHRSGVA